MKKILLILLSVMPIVLNAQITIVQGDLPGVNTLWVLANDTGYTGVISAGGGSQTWNYASLQNNEQDSTAFISSAGSPYAVNFPGSNMVVVSINPVGYTYYTSNSSGLFADGSVDPSSGLILNFNPARLLVPVPFTYNSLLTHNSRFQIDTTMSGFGYRFVSLTQQTFNGDGYGSLQLPNGTYPATLRIKETDLMVDSIYVDFGTGYIPLPGYTPSPTQTSNYMWVRNGVGALLLTMNADSLGQQATGGANYFLSSGPAGIVNNTPANVKNAYPNPSSDFVSVDLSNFNGQAETLYVNDITGRQIDVMNIQNIDLNTFDVRHYENGRYILRIAGNDMQPVTGSFTVLH